MNIRVLLIDNHDSFTWNLAQLFHESGMCSLSVVPYDQSSLEQVSVFDKVVFSPGPGLPGDIPIMRQVVEKYSGRKSILGICLGHQAIIESFGGGLFNLEAVVHGIRKEIQVTDPDEPLFSGLPLHFQVGLYHSWAAVAETLPENLKITSVDADGLIMSVAHKQKDVRGLQFHPESYMSEYGLEIIRNWLRC
jgi:anthranilate synthase component II